MTEEEKIEIKTSPFFRNNWKLILIILIIGTAFYLRIYHLDYPVIGYHNWKETHYLTEARNFEKEGFFANGFFVPAWDYPTLNADSSGVHSDSFPTTSILVGLAFKIFGDNLALARLLSILFSLGCIIFIYLIVKELFKREDLALISAAVLAINPLHIFFGRQVQLINYALFFVLVGTYFFIKFRKEASWKNVILFSFFLSLGIMTKYSHFLFALPIIFTFPYKLFKEKEVRPKLYVMLLIGLIFLAWLPYSNAAGKGANSEDQFSGIFNVSVLFSPEFWDVMSLFFNDNFTYFGLALFFLGIIFYFFMTNVNKTSFSHKFILLHLIFAFLWFAIMSYKIQGHNYHQYPLLFIYVILTSFSVLFIANLVSRKSKIKILKWPVVLILGILLFSYGSSASDRMFNTQFPGLDIAGDYIKENKISGERVMHSSNQAYGLLWHGDIKGTKGIPATVENMEIARVELNATWLFIYVWDLNVLSTEDERSEYIKSNYELKQMAFTVNSNNQISPIYFLLKYGGEFSEDNVNQALRELPPQTRKYEYTSGEYDIYYLNVD